MFKKKYKYRDKNNSKNIHINIRTVKTILVDILH